MNGGTRIALEIACELRAAYKEGLRDVLHRQWLIIMLIYMAYNVVNIAGRASRMNYLILVYRVNDRIENGKKHKLLFN